MRVLVAPDTFKGPLRAVEVAAAIAEGLEEAGVPSRSLPLADGGDGSVDAALSAGFAPRGVSACGADGRRRSRALAVLPSRWRCCVPARAGRTPQDSPEAGGGELL